MTSLKADRTDWGGPLKPPQNTGKTNATKTTRTTGPAAAREPTNPLNLFKIKGKLINIHQNSSRNHQGSSRISQNDFLIHFATKSSTNPKGTAARHTPGDLSNRSPEPQRRDHWSH